MIGKLLYKAVWVGSFCLATYSLSRLFAASRALAHGGGNVTMVLIWFGILALSFATFSYDAYAKSRREGKVKHPIRLFEALYHIQHQERKQQC